MNIFSKAFYRSIHFGFYLIKPLLPYKPPVVLDKIEEITTKLVELKKKTVMLVSDKMVREIKLTESLEQSLINAGIKVVIYDEVCPNPTSDNVEKGVALYNKEKCDSIIAFGGGSPIDCAKAIGARIVRPKNH